MKQLYEAFLKITAVDSKCVFLTEQESCCYIQHPITLLPNNMSATGNASNWTIASNLPEFCPPQSSMVILGAVKIEREML